MNKTKKKIVFMEVLSSGFTRVKPLGSRRTLLRLSLPSLDRILISLLHLRTLFFSVSLLHSLPLLSSSFLSFYLPPQLTHYSSPPPCNVPSAALYILEANHALALSENCTDLKVRIELDHIGVII
jgi:hypothetical protein